MNVLITGRYKLKKKIPFFYIDIGWDKYFKKIGFSFKMYNPKMDLSYIKTFDCLIISGGGDIYEISKNRHDKFRDLLEIKLVKIFIKLKKPIISVCRGFQLIGWQFKNKLEKFSKHVKKSHFLKIKKNILLKEKKIQTNSFHNFGFKNLNSKFLVIGKTYDGSIEIALLKNKKILCTMFHPERYNKDQKKINSMILNFLRN